MGEINGICKAKRMTLKAGEVDDGRRSLVEAGEACEQRENKCPGHASGVTLVTAWSWPPRRCCSSAHIDVYCAFIT